MTDGGQRNSVLREYSEFLSKCEFVICPPGNFSNECRRYYEAFVLGSIPIVTSATIQDFTNFDYWPNRHSKGLKNATRRSIFLEILKLSEKERTALKIKIHNDFASNCNVLRKKLIELDSLNYPGINL